MIKKFFWGKNSIFWNNIEAVCKTDSFLILFFNITLDITSSPFSITMKVVSKNGKLWELAKTKYKLYLQKQQLNYWAPWINKLASPKHFKRGKWIKWKIYTLKSHKVDEAIKKLWQPKKGQKILANFFAPFWFKMFCCITYLVQWTY